MTDWGRILMLMGASLFVVGLLLSAAGRLPWFGSLPGDVTVQRDNFTFYAPIGTMIVLSLLLTVVLNLIARLWR